MYEPYLTQHMSPILHNVRALSNTTHQPFLIKLITRIQHNLRALRHTTYEPYLKRHRMPHEMLSIIQLIFPPKPLTLSAKALVSFRKRTIPYVTFYNV